MRVAERLRDVLRQPEEEQQRQKLGRFEESEVDTSIRFQAGWIAIEVLGALFFQLMRWADAAPVRGVWLVVPLACSAAFRFVCLLAAIRPLRQFVHQLAMTSLIVGVCLLTTCHPEVSRHVSWHPPGNESELANVPGLGSLDSALQSLNSTVFDNHLNDLNSSIQQPQSTQNQRSLSWTAQALPLENGTQVRRLQLPCPGHCQPDCYNTCYPDGRDPNDPNAPIPTGSPSGNSGGPRSYTGNGRGGPGGPDGPDSQGDVGPPTSGSGLPPHLDPVSQAFKALAADIDSLADIEAIRKALAEREQEHQEAQEEWQESHRRHKDMYLHDHHLVVTGLLIQLSYMAAFVLPSRKGVIVLPVSLGIYAAVVVTLRNDDQGTENLGDFLQQFAQEFTTLAFAVVVNLVAKVRAERTQRQLCVFLDAQAKEVIHEKVLRCQAEYKHDRLEEDIVNGELPGIAFVGDSSVTESQVADPRVPDPPSLKSGHTIAKVRPRPRGPASLYSAPPATRGFLEAGLDCGTRSRGDCLPPGASVWVEGQALPAPVDKISKGSRLLCYDTVGRCPKYVEVTDAQILVGETEWVAINLADGTEMSVTANHPMQPQPAVLDPKGSLPTAAVEAKNLKVGTDCLMVLKLVPVVVTKVRRCPPAVNGAAGTRVSLVLHQPERHEVFVAPPNASPNSATVAVGSANAGLAPPGATVPRGPVVKRTFIDDAPVDVGSMRRTSSLPPRLRSSPIEEEDEQYHRDHRPTSRERKHSPGKRTPHDRHVIEKRRMKRSNSDSEFSSTIKSSESAFGTEVLVAANEAQTPHPAQLSQVMRTRQLGLPSMGSALHSTGECQVCIFHNRHVHDGRAPCWKGVLCDHCHLSHEPVGRKKQKSGGMRRYLRKTTATHVEL